MILYQLDSPIERGRNLEPDWPPLKFLFGIGLFLPRETVRQALFVRLSLSG